MKPTTLLDGITTPDGHELTLTRHDRDFFILLDGDDLMMSRRHGSEDELARLALAELGERPAPRVLVGGLGMGFTLRAALDCARGRKGATVTVAEVFPTVVDWNRRFLGHLAGHPLDDTRTRVVVADVRHCVEDAGAGWDAILLDVDNGPSAMTLYSNRALYTDDGLRRIHGRLTPGGVLAVWSADPDPQFVRSLRRCGFQARAVRVSVRAGGKGGWHTIFLGRRT